MRVEKSIKNNQTPPRNQKFSEPEDQKFIEQKDTFSVLASESRQNPKLIKLQQSAIQKDLGHLSRISPPGSTVAQQKPRPNYIILVNGKYEAESLTQDEAESDLEDILRENPEIDRDCIEVWQKVGVKVGVFLDI